MGFEVNEDIWEEEEEEKKSFKPPANAFSLILNWGEYELKKKNI